MLPGHAGLLAEKEVTVDDFRGSLSPGNKSSGTKNVKESSWRLWVPLPSLGGMASSLDTEAFVSNMI